MVVRSYVEPERYRHIIAAMIDVSRHCKKQANTRFAPTCGAILHSWVGLGQAPTLCVGRLRLNGDCLHPIPNLGGYLQYILEYLLILFYF